MNRFTIGLSTVALSVFGVQGATTGSIGTYILSPEPGSYENLSTIKIDFPDTGIMGIDVPETSGITLVSDTDSSVVYKVSKCDYVYDTYATMHFTREGADEEGIQSPGTYTLRIPAGSFYKFNKKDECNAEIVATYTITKGIGEPTPPEVYNPFESVTVYPANNEKLDRLQVFKICFPDCAKGLVYPFGDVSGVTLQRKGDEDVYRIDNIQVFGPDYNTFEFGFNKGSDIGYESHVFTEPGEYVLTVPAGLFYENGNAVDSNPAYSWTYVVESASNPFDNAEIIPASESVVGSLQNFTLTFPDLDNISYPFGDLSGVTLQREGDSEKYEIDSVVVRGEKYNIIDFGFDKAGTISSNRLLFTEGGVYTLTLPSGVFSKSGDSEVRNPAYTWTFRVDPALNFTCKLKTAEDKVYESLTSIELEAGDNMKSLSVVEGFAGKCTLSQSDNVIDLTASVVDPRTLSFSLPSGVSLGVGDWSFEVPAGMLAGESVDGEYRLVNVEPVRATYKIAVAEQFDYLVSPTSGSELELLNKVTVTFSGEGLKQVMIDESKGACKLSGGTLSSPAEMKGMITGNGVELNVQSSLGDGTYTVTIPDGYIYTIDSNNLRSDVKGFDLTYIVKKPSVPDFTTGMLMLNEGWFGHDNGSLNFIGDDRVIYNAFQLQNPGKTFGTTSCSGNLYGDRLYVVSKQATGGAYLVGMDSETLEEIGRIEELPNTGKSIQAYYFTPVSSTKGYLSTNIGLFVINTKYWDVTKQLTADWLLPNYPFGESVVIGNHLFVVGRYNGIVTVDIEDDSLNQIDLPTAASLFTTADGSLYCATENEDNEFVKINPYTMECEKMVDIKVDKSKIQSPWSTWRMSSVASDRDREVVYFAKAGFSVSSLSKYDFSKDEYTADFIQLPGKADGLESDQILYGQGVSVDPSTGYIVVNATEAGYGAHYEKNWVYFFNPEDGKMIPEKTISLKDYYWFPAQMLYPGFSTPEITVSPVTIVIPEGESEVSGSYSINMPDVTTLQVGNKSLMTYTAQSGDTSVFEVSGSSDLNEYGRGEYTLTAVGEGDSVLTLTAMYKGKECRVEIPVEVKREQGIDTVNAERIRDVYTLSGILLIKDATDEQISSLPEGIYIIGGKKVKK